MIKNQISIFEKNSRKTDAFLTDYSVDSKFNGKFAESVDFIVKTQIGLEELWEEFIHQFDAKTDGDNGWRIEYWGKMMRGASFVCAYLRDEKLYKTLEKAVRGLLATQDELGRITTYPIEKEFDGWDMWGRKYVLLGLQYFYEICDDEALKAEITGACKRHADYIIEHFEKTGGRICDASRHWLGINSLSILEPFVRLYNQTGEQRYFDFATKIVKEGEDTESHIFKLAYEGELYPYQYPTTKAYEMMSCFEGLIEYYRVTGNEKYRIAAANFGKKVIESDVTIIGCSGCTHELFDHSAWRQTDDNFKGIMQETCVSVTWMKFCSQLLRLTGDPVYADMIERSYFNAYLGSINTHNNVMVVPPRKGNPEMRRFLTFDSYTPLRAGLRNRQTGGVMRLDNGLFYGCCACIGSAGAGLMPRINLLYKEDTLAVNFYFDGEIAASTPSGNKLGITVSGGYPYEGSISMKLALDAPECFKLMLRIPEWSRETLVKVCGESMKAKSGYLTLDREWKSGDVIEIEFDMNVYAVYPEVGAPGEDKYIAFRRGCIVLAADKRMGLEPAGKIAPVVENGRAVVLNEKAVHPEVSDAIVCCEIKTESGSARLIDYASGGQTYDADSEFAAWLVR